MALLLALCLAGPAQAQSSPAAAGTAPADRFEQVFDRAGDDGKLVARFIRMHLDTAAEEKSGDCSVVSSPDGRLMLVDSGSTACADQVLRCLEALGVERLDAVLLSHPHIDHVGGLPRILDRYPVGRVYMSRLEYPTAAFRDAVEAIKRKGIEIVYLAEGSTFDFGSKVRATVYNPERDIAYYPDFPKNSTQFINDRSLAVKLVYGESSLLLMGDVYTPREIELVEKYGTALAADVVKMGHHGSDTSSSKTFIRTVSPKIAVAMHDNLASLQVYKNYRKIGAAAYVTAIDGCVKVSGDEAGEWTVLTQLDRQGDFLN